MATRKTDKDSAGFISTRELASRWACSRSTASRLAQNGGLGRYYLGHGRNGMLRYSLEEVIDYEKSRRIS